MAMRKVRQLPEDKELIDLPKEPQPKEQVDHEHQHWYPKRQRTVPVRYGIDEYVDTPATYFQIEQP